MQSKRNFVGMRRAPGNNALELEGIVSDCADFDQLAFDDLRVSHRTSMSHFGTQRLCDGPLVEPWYRLNSSGCNLPPDPDLMQESMIGWYWVMSESAAIVKLVFCFSIAWNLFSEYTTTGRSGG
jgi:hypothetical protein